MKQSCCHNCQFNRWVREFTPSRPRHSHGTTANKSPTPGLASCFIGARLSSKDTAAGGGKPAVLPSKGTEADDITVVKFDSP